MPRERKPNEPGDEDDRQEPFPKSEAAIAGPRWEDVSARSFELHAGARFGPYEIQEWIGAGGMGAVYRARDTRLARDVALKILPPRTADSVEALARFEREARAVAALNHPNILALYDVGSEGGVHYAVTELLEGETLRERLLGGRPLTPRKGIEYAVQIARGLAAAHDRGIVHRDLKPENVFVTRDGRVKILDFGIALYEGVPGADQNQTVAPLTGTGFTVGTIGYIAPEQVLGKPATPRSDLFAFGVVLFEMLTGKHPFMRETIPETQTAVLREDPAPLDRAVPGLAPAIIRLIELCLQKQPADRPESARDLGLFFEVLGDATVRLPALAATDWTAAHRLRRWLLAISCGLLLVITGTTWAFVRITADRAVDDAIDADLSRAERMVRHLHREHLQRITLTARLVASFPELKALFATDVATIQDFLLGFQQRFPGTPVLIALGPNGAVLARTDDPAAQPDSISEPLAALAANQGEGAAISLGDRPYLAVAAASEAAGTIFGYVVAAEAIDQRFAEALSDATQDEVVLLSAHRVLASTLRAVQTPWSSIADWRSNAGASDRFLEVSIGRQRFAARETALTAEPAVSAIIVTSRDEAVGSYIRIERGLGVIAIAGLALVLLSGLWLKRRLEG
jgi:hypothetical protein